MIMIRNLETSLQALERLCILRSLAAAGGRRQQAARALGLSRKNLWEKMRDLKISPCRELAQIDQGEPVDWTALIAAVSPDLVPVRHAEPDICTEGVLIVDGGDGLRPVAV